MSDNDTPKKQGLSVLAWIFITLGIVTLVGGVLCCGGLAFVGFSAAPKIVSTPAEVSTLAQQIIKFDVPDWLKPEQGMEMNFLSIMKMRMANFKEATGQGRLILMEMEVGIGDQAQRNAQKGQMRDAMKEQASKDPKNEAFTPDKTEAREFMVAGKPVSFQFSEGEAMESKKRMHEVRAEFETARGIAIFLLSLEETAWDEAKVVALLESMK